MSMFTLYIFTMLDSINSFLFFCVLCSIIFSFFYSTIKTMDIVDNKKDKEEEWRKVKPKIISTICVSIILSIIYTLMPDTKQMAFIYVASKLSNNNHIQSIGDKALTIPDKALEIVDLKLNEYLKEIKGKNNE